MRSRMRSRVASVLGVAAAGVLTSVLIPASAHADGVNYQSCNNSGTAEYVAFPYRGWLASTIIDPGSCWQASLSGVASEEAVGYQYVNGNWLAVATDYFNDDSSWTEFDF